MSKKLKIKIPTYDIRSLVAEVFGVLSEQVFASWNLPKPLSVRHNTILDPENLAFADLISSGITVQKMPWFVDGWLLSSTTLDTHQLIETLESTNSWKNNWLYRQNLASMIPPLLLELKDGDQVLDLTAAPGSKTSQIAALLHNSGKIVANDLSRTRIFKLKANLDRLGVTNTITNLGLGEKIWQQFPETFDTVLVDAPCSMMGRINLLDPKTSRIWSTKESKSLAKRQQWLLQSALSAARPGSVVVYSTCTLSPFENELVIDWTLKNSRRAIALENAQLKNLEPQLETGEIITMPGLTNWQGMELDQELKKTWRVVPNSQMEGFFVAKFRVL